MSIQNIVNEDQHRVNCFQFISEGQAYIIPSIAIIEILPFNEIQSVPNQPPWLYGVLPWKGINIPVVNLSLEPVKQLEKTKLTRLLIFHSILEESTKQQLPFLATVIAQIPKSLVILESQLRYFSEKRTQDNVSYPVVGKGIQAKITDLEKLSEQVVQFSAAFIH